MESAPSLWEVVSSVTESNDRLFAEIDRQLEEVREQAATVAARAGLVLSAAGIAAAILAARIQRQPSDYSLALWPLGVAVVISLVALAPTLATGPEALDLQGWSHYPRRKSARAIRRLFLAKLMVLEANRRRLLVMNYAFYLECAAVVVAVFVAFSVGARQ